MLTFDEPSHTYRLNGVVVPSVSQVIAPLYAGVFEAIKPDVLERKRQLGTAVHKACELDDKGDLDEDSLTPELRPYLDAWRTFRATHKVEVIENEKQLGHSGLRFAGTIDRILRIDGEKWLIDLKTTAMLYPPVKVQLAGYSLLYGEPTIRRAAMKLKDDGRFVLDESDDPADDNRCFMGLLALHHWKARNAK